MHTYCQTETLFCICTISDENLLMQSYNGRLLKSGSYKLRKVFMAVKEIFDEK